MTMGYRTYVLAVASVVLASCATVSPSPASMAADRERLLHLHAEAIRAHREGNVEIILADESPDYVVANRGAISHPTIEQRRAFLGPYLTATRFTEYVDTVPPIVSVSRDGTLGWVMVQVRARGEQTDEAGAKRPIAFESAWIELYEKRQGQWLRVGNVSNFKP
jgi:hypothetical protein